MKFQGKKAIVTGANRSIGQAIAIAFAKEGAELLCHYRSDEEGAKKTVMAIEELGGRAEAVYADFSQLEGVKTFCRHALDFLGRVDFLVNNAGAYDTSAFLDVDVEDFHNLLQVGVVAPMLLTQMVARQMIEQQIAGSIINIGSISGVRPYPNRVAHATTKAALHMLTKNMALELAKFRIRVNAIAPGATPYTAVGTEEIAKEIPLLRVGRVKDHATAAVFLASEDASWMTGQIMVIDGGQALSF